MSKKPPETETVAEKSSEKSNWTNAAVAAGAAIGSAALAAALLYATQRKGKSHAPARPEEAPETD